MSPTSYQTAPPRNPILTYRPLVGQWQPARGYGGDPGNTHYAPLDLVDGGAEFVGSDSRRALTAIGAAARAAKVPIRISRLQPSVSAGANVRVEIDSARDSGDVYLVVADNFARSQVLRGENQGRSLQHIAVVRRMEPLGKWNSRTLFTKGVLVSQAMTNTARVVAFVQESGIGRVLGAAMLGPSR